MRALFISAVLASLLVLPVKARGERPPQEPFRYSFLLMDRPRQLFTMRQFNESYLSAYRLAARGLNRIASPKRSMLIQAGFSLLTLPLTHEEGHRSILTAEGIGSISQPYFNSKGAAYVVGVTDATLEDLRDHNLPAYIRLHTAGLESDYMLVHRVETLAAFSGDQRENYWWEYLMRKGALVGYFALGLLPELEPDIEEEEDERDRDIVGHDVYGAIRHLHRPDMPFYRYTKYDDLTDDEKDFVRRAGLRSLLNLIHPLMLGIPNLPLGDHARWSAGLGYAMGPFGDFIDENLWLRVRGVNIHLYLRQFQNQKHWFPAGGVRLVDLAVTGSLRASLEGHLWQQPRDLEFRAARGEWGGCVDLTLRYRVFRGWATSVLRAVTVDLGLMFKREGFVPEEVLLGEATSVRLGASLEL